MTQGNGKGTEKDKRSPLEDWLALPSWLGGASRGTLPSHSGSERDSHENAG